eukprot:CAMPEP_0176387116 /NCGR_PEP_ID=MMETSP0126-20121128/36493_1 /TAXON_ID=141414 ORGANISM="Strombidinopsis acuminatum, Strain SPMC142" /NCGR_SAMPLE_ID=MMETSP0126 /ASSEMBLY_ACC=CAM_ASM_000229 /LENGTH=47 /DNA_ID= /DNA_START= /DNA_END= /DNA_ORIENTATION=
MVPDTEMADKEAKEEQDKLAKILSSLTENDKQNILDEAKELKQRQDT